MYILQRYCNTGSFCAFFLRVYSKCKMHVFDHCDVFVLLFDCFCIWRSVNEMCLVILQQHTLCVIYLSDLCCYAP